VLLELDDEGGYGSQLGLVLLELDDEGGYGL
jgi:hypothetical protein